MWKGRDLWASIRGQVSFFFERCLLQIPCDPDAEVFVSPLRVTANVISELWPQADGRSTLSSRTQTELRACRLTGPRTAAGTPTSHTHTLRYTHLYQEQNSLFSELVLLNPVYWNNTSGSSTPICLGLCHLYGDTASSEITRGRTRLKKHHEIAQCVVDGTTRRIMTLCEWNIKH